MNKMEAMKLLAVIKVSFPNFRPDDIDMAADVWADVLSDFSYQQLGMALKTYIRTNTSGFAPSPGQLIELLSSVKHSKDETETEAWMRVAIALRNGAYGSEEEFEKFPPMVQRAVGSAKQLRIWALDENFNEEVAKAQFLRVYREMAKRNKDYEKMPEDVRRIIDNAMGKNMITAGDKD